MLFMFTCHVLLISFLYRKVELGTEWPVKRSGLKGTTSEAELFGSADVEPLIMSALLELSQRNKLATEKKI